MVLSRLKRSFSCLIWDENFEKQTLKITRGLHPSDTNFPWARLSACAEIFIRRQKNIDILPGIDEFLIDLVEKCSSKDIALAACAHLLSIDAVQNLLSKSKPLLGSIPGLLSYTQIILAINYHKPQIFNEDDAKYARTVHQLLSQSVHDPASVLRPLVTLIGHGVPQCSYLGECLDALARQACLILSTRMEAFKASADWFAAYADAPWLRDDFKDLSNRHHAHPNDVRIVEILNQTFPSWSSWAAWEPNEATLEAYTAHLSTRPRDKSLIKDLLALEGPDFDVNNAFRRKYATMREQLFSVNRTKLDQQCGTVRFDFSGSGPNHIRATLDVLNKLIVDVCLKDTGVDGNCRMSLLQQVCLSGSINEEKLSLLKAAFDTESATIISAVREVKMADAEGRDPDIEQLSILFKALDWDASTELRRLLGQSVVASMCRHLEEMQGMLKTVVNADRNWTLADLQLLETLQAFGETCVRVPKLKSYFPEEIKAALERWPEKWEMQECNQIILFARAQLCTYTKWVILQVETYVLNRLIPSWPLSIDYRSSHHATEFVEPLLHVWRSNKDHDRRHLALVAAHPDTNPDPHLRLKCLQQLEFIDDKFLQVLKLLSENDKTKAAGEACVLYSRALVVEEHLIETWRLPLRPIILEDSERLEICALQTLSVENWISWVDDLGVIFPDMIQPTHESPSFFLTYDIHTWMQTLRSNLATLKRLESREGMRHSDAVTCILRGGDVHLRHELERIIEFLNVADFTNVACEEDTFIALIKRLDRNGRNAKAIRTAIFQVNMATIPGVEACLHVLDSYQEVSLQVAETMLACWLNNESMTDRDRLALEAVAVVLEIDAGNPGEPALDSLEAANVHLDERYQALIAEAVRLEGLRIAFKVKDPNWIALVLKELDVEDSFPLEDIMHSLPLELIDVVERISRDEVEFQLPLTKLTALQKKALGSGTAQSLLVRFSPGFDGLPPNFCLHWDHEPKELAINGHSPCIAFPGSEPEERSCYGRPTPGVYQLSRIFSLHLIEHGFSSLQDLYNLLLSELANFHTKCLVCAVPHAYNTRRATVCPDPRCLATYKKTDIDVRISDLRHDPAVVDLLLSMAYSCSDMSLLPDCPTKDINRLKQIINNLPAITSLQNNHRLEKTIPTATNILSWALTSYRGFLVSATANLKIPSFPSSRQFLLANASPQLERAFDTNYQKHNKTSRVVFHGTTMERMYAILSQGLKDLSGTPLQRHGHAFGNGIYISSEPKTAWAYAAQGSPGWGNSDLGNRRVLLACELTGNWTPVSGDILVVTEPSCLMVRYLFLLPNQADVPIAAHVVPALSSVFAGLRSGAL
ncbi:hypothetical protein FKW77_002231 [Venturia effusa]|uniref:PARP catalytic domain-containing protein n=1 Tax=Venturia effusa TaxID=50376 RepID=A0A517LMB8_9PEZI|nr:hypothetical protein FKW77_002231 [Venturia effusa]